MVKTVSDEPCWAADRSSSAVECYASVHVRLKPAFDVVTSRIRPCLGSSSVRSDWGNDQHSVRGGNLNGTLGRCKAVVW